MQVKLTLTLTLTSTDTDTDKDWQIEKTLIDGLNYLVINSEDLVQLKNTELDYPIRSPLDNTRVGFANLTINY